MSTTTTTGEMHPTMHLQWRETGKLGSTQRFARLEQKWTDGEKEEWRNVETITPPDGQPAPIE